MITFRITGDVAIRLMQLAPDKELTPQLVWLPKNDAIALFLALVSGDGSRRRDDGRQSFIQKSLDCAEWAQILGIRLGFRAIISKRTGNTYVVYYTTGGWLTMRGTNGVAPVHTVSKGRVWCPSVESGFWLARRNGKPFITGNTFPERLPEIVIRLATSAHGVCEVCLEPWRRRVTRETVPAHVHERFEAARAVTATETGRTDGHTMKRPNYRRKVLREEWEAGCQCGRGVIPATVCDPFLGSGRSAIVAKRLGRSFIGIDINASYVEMAKRAVEEAV